MFSRMKRLTVVVLVATMAATLMLGSALAYSFPSTNELNKNLENPSRPGQDGPYVDLVSQGIGEVELRFSNLANGLAFFEYRIDGVTQGTTPHPVVTGDVIHQGVSVPSGNEVFRSFNASSVVEVRLALGGERDWDFDWTPFYVLPDVQSKDDCMKGGWQDFGFKNQGQCIQFVNTGKDSR